VHILLIHEKSLRPPIAKMFRFKTSTFSSFCFFNARLVLLEFASGCRSLFVSVHPRKIVLVFVTVALGLRVLANYPRWTFLNASIEKNITLISEPATTNTDLVAAVLWPCNSTRSKLGLCAQGGEFLKSS